MANITKEIQNALGAEFSFLKHLETEVSKKENTCSCVFLFPESKGEMSQEEKEKITNFMNDFLNLQSLQLKVFFKKSHLDEKLVHLKVCEHIKKNYPSIQSSITNESVVILKNGTHIVVEIGLSNENNNFFIKARGAALLQEDLERNFIATFEVHSKIISHEALNLLGAREEIMMNNRFASQLSKTPRFEVLDPVVIVGKEIMPKPEYLKNITSPKSRVILAGVVENFQMFEFLSKTRKNKDGSPMLKHRFTFLLKDPTKKIRCVHFATKTGLNKLTHIKDGDHLLVLADVRFEDGRMDCVVQEISACTEKKNQVFDVESSQTLRFDANNHQYAVVFPEPFITKEQTDIFAKKNQPNNFLLENTFVVFDTETTGFHPETDELIEIGACKVRNGVVIETFQSLIKPKRPIPFAASNVNNITNQMVANAPSPAAVLADFAKFCFGCTLVAHNAQFDMSFIQAAGKRFGISFDNEVFDTLLFFRKNYQFKNNKLGTLVKEFGIVLNDAHRALADAFATAELFIITQRK